MQLTSLIYTPQNRIFQHFLTILGQMVHANLVRQNEYLKVENEILRSKLGNQIRTTYEEKLRIIRYGLAVGGPIKKIISIVSYQTFRKWVNAFEEGNLHKNVRLGRPRRTPAEVIEILPVLDTGRTTPPFG